MKYYQVLIAVFIAVFVIGGVGYWMYAQKQGGVSQSLQTQVLSGTYTDNTMRLVAGQFYIGVDDVSFSKPPEEYVTFRNRDEALHMLGINPTLPIGDTCRWVVHATVEISDRKIELVNTIDTIQADTATLERVVSKDSATQECPLSP